MRRAKQAAPLRTVDQISLGEGPGSPLVIGCGDRFRRELRTELAKRLQHELPAVAFVLVDGLCRDQAGLVTALAGRAPEAVAIAACGTTRAVELARDAVRFGIDAARCAGVSVATRDETEDGAEVVGTIVMAAARRVAALALEPRAGVQRLQLRGTIGRRELLTGWLPTPRRSASVATFRCLGAERCRACLSACPDGALRVVDGELSVDPLRCSRCGACAFACPTAAISVPGAALGPLAAQLETLLEGGIKRFTLACEAATPHDGERRVELVSGSVTVGVPCAASIGPGLLLSLVVRNCAVTVSSCASCRCQRSLEGTGRFVARVLEATDKEDLCSLIAFDRSGASNGTADERTSWRILRQPAVPVEIDLTEPQSTNAAARALLAGGPPRTAVVLDDSAPGGVVRIDAWTCTRCGACALVCPTGAIASSPTGAPHLDAARCVACGKCAAVCPERAIDVGKGLDLSALATDGVPSCRRNPGTAEPAVSSEGATIVAAVTRRLAALGSNEALLQALRAHPSAQRHS